MKACKSFYIIPLFVIFFVSCNQNPYPGFTLTEDGLAYKIIKKGTGTEKPKTGDLMYIDVRYEAEDTVFFDSYKTGNTLTLQFPTAPYKGSIDEAFRNMCKGDSALIWTSADSFFVKVLNSEVPKKIKKGSKLLFTVTLRDLMSKQQIEEKQKAAMAEREKLAKENKEKELKLIEDYLRKNKLSVKPRPSGLYIIEQKKGNGKIVKSGDMVTVHYVGQFLDGKVFDSSLSRGVPIDFQVGVGQVIKGWDEALLALTEGSKAKLIIPSNLAYGAEGASTVIPPYTPLVFDIILLKVNSK